MGRPVRGSDEKHLDEKLTVLAFKKCGISNEVVVMRDGAAALAYTAIWYAAREAPTGARAAPAFVRT
jgi:hypothetical protein